MSPAQSPGTSSGWSKTVIVAPGVVDDWGEANITKLFTETIGVAPQAGMKYYLECWWLDTETGFTGESMWISAICKEGSTAYNDPYVSRARITQDDVAEGSSGEGLDFELSPGSAICSADAILYGDNNVASTTFVLKKAPKNFIEGKAMVLALGTLNCWNGSEIMRFRLSIVQAIMRSLPRFTLQEYLLTDNSLNYDYSDRK